MTRTRSAEIRADLDHPIIDSDAHTVEFAPAMLDYVKEIGGQDAVDAYHVWQDENEGPAWAWHRASPEVRMERRIPRFSFWNVPMKNTADRAAASLPRLLHQRMDEIGIDFMVVYPTWWLWANLADHEETRRVHCRAFNHYQADLYREWSDRLTPVATIPMHTPTEAIEELEYAVTTLGMKAVMLAGHVSRPLTIDQEPSSSRPAYWLDTFGLDSAHDYDPVWAKCVELGVCPTFHTGSMGSWDARSSISNAQYNHIGHFAAAGEATCKSLFLGGVTRRFPELKFAFLEGGVGWACDLYSDLIGHWQKRNRKALEDYNPANVDHDLLEDLFMRFGDERFQDHAAMLRELPAGQFFVAEDPATLDEWAACAIEQEEDIRDCFVPNFYFGCEADDPMTVWAFNDKINPLGARLRAIFSSDIGHWDVSDMRRVVEEAYEPLEKGWISEQDFRDFVFTNPASLWTGMNPNFFKGTTVENDVRKLQGDKP